MSEVKARLLVQPFGDGFDLRDFLSYISADETFMRLRIVVAWAKRSGLQRVESDLRRISSRGGSLELVVGISEGGATRQGLELAREIFDSVHVVHDRSGRTFHPKLYVADGAEQALVMIGSNNLTAGGIYYNYEAGSILELDMNDIDDREYLAAVENLIGKVTGDKDICIELTDDVLDELISNRRYRIGNEDENRALRLSGLPENLDTDVDIDIVDTSTSGAPPIFGKSQVPKKPGISASSAKSDKSTPASSASTSLPPRPRPDGSVEIVPDSLVERRWFKKMSNSDAQQKGTPNTQVTGNLKLTEAQLPINHTTFFRYDFFGDCNWASKEVTRGIKEEAIVPFHVVADGGPIGVYSLKIDHAEYRVAAQGNVATWLHWGNDLSRYLRDNSHVGDYVTLERRTDGSFSLVISDEPSGQFIS